MADGQELIEVPKQAVAHTPQTGVINIIEQLLSRPELDIDKVERLLDIQAKEQGRFARMEFIAALAAAQPNFPAIPQNGKGQNEKKYAKWEDMQSRIFPVLSENGLHCSHRTRVENNLVIVTCIISHIGGHVEETSLPLPIDAGGQKNAVQAIGSSVSYGKRYTAAAILGIRLEGEDDDGNKAAAPATIDDAQADFVETLLEQSGRDKDRFLAYMKVDRIEDITVKGFDGVVAMLQKAVADKAVA